MADLATQERLQPSLLDRITDYSPEQSEESRARRVLSMKQLRESVLRDLAWLLNTNSFEATCDLTDYPEVKRSVLNYGMPDTSGRTATSMDARAFERTIRQALLEFEPRLVANSLEVRAVADDSLMNHNVLSIEIQGELWALPLPLQLFLKTQVDLESGAIQVADLGGRR